MLALTAALLFTLAFILAVAVIVWMFSSYRDKIIAAAMFEPIPKNEPTFRVTEVRRAYRF